MPAYCFDRKKINIYIVYTNMTLLGLEPATKKGVAARSNLIWSGSFSYWVSSCDRGSCGPLGSPSLNVIG